MPLVLTVKPALYIHKVGFFSAPSFRFAFGVAQYAGARALFASLNTRPQMLYLCGFASAYK